MPFLFNPPFSTLLARDNTWTGLNIFNDDILFNGEVQGTKHTIVFTHDDALVIAGGANAFIKIGEVLMTATKGFIVSRSGSMSSLSINYDVTATGILQLFFEILVNGVGVFVSRPSRLVGNDKIFSERAVRNGITFVEDDVISVRWRTTAMLPLQSITIAKTISMLEFYYDD